MLGNHTRGREYQWGTYTENCILSFAGASMADAVQLSGGSHEDVFDAISAAATEYLNEPYMLEHNHCIEEDYYVSCQADKYELDYIDAVGGNDMGTTIIDIRDAKCNIVDSIQWCDNETFNIQVVGPTIQIPTITLCQTQATAYANFTKAVERALKEAKRNAAR